VARGWARREKTLLLRPPGLVLRLLDLQLPRPLRRRDLPAQMLVGQRRRRSRAPAVTSRKASTTAREGVAENRPGHGQVHFASTRCTSTPGAKRLAEGRRAVCSHPPDAVLTRLLQVLGRADVKRRADGFTVDRRPAREQLLDEAARIQLPGVRASILILGEDIAEAPSSGGRWRRCQRALRSLRLLLERQRPLVFGNRDDAEALAHLFEAREPMDA